MIITNNHGQYLKLDYGFHDWTTYKACATVFTDRAQAERVLATVQSMAFPKKIVN